jgi:hypothetical protein
MLSSVLSACCGERLRYVQHHYTADLSHCLSGEFENLCGEYWKKDQGGELTPGESGREGWRISPGWGGR